MTLTDRQRQVAELAAKGCSDREIGRALGISRDTVRAHIFAIAQKIPNPLGLPQKAAVRAWFFSAA